MSLHKRKVTKDFFGIMFEILASMLLLLILSQHVSQVLLSNVSTAGRPLNLNVTFPWFDGEASARHRITSKNDAPLFLLDRFSSRDENLPSPDGKNLNCRRAAKCERLNYTTCMGVKLPYSFTTRDLVEDSLSQEQIQEKLQLWRGLRHIPKCWAVIQPFLCALYMPKCENETVNLPSQEMCKMTLSPCRILDIDNKWSSLFKCEDTARFPPMCKNEARELKFNTTGQCLSPLVPTDNALAFYEGVEGCGIQCRDPLFSEDEHRQIHKLIAWAGTTCLFFNLFTVITFLIDWRSANKYPALIIFYINGCFLLSCVGWLAQFSHGTRTDIVCRKDGTLRMSEPSAGENLSCVIVFVLVYYFIIAAMVWFVILTFAWHLSFQALGKIQEKIDKKGAYFHLVAWSLPLVLTITIMALGEIDGNSVAGICFVGYMSHPIRAGFLLGPILSMVLVGGYFLSRGLLTLVRLKITSQEIVSERATAKIRETIVRMGLFSLLSFVFVVVTFVCHIYEFQHRGDWLDSFRKYVICRITRSESGELGTCKMDTRPSVMMLQLHFLALFCAGIVMSSWVWTTSTIDTWKRFLRRVFKSEIEEPVKLKKHKVIAQAFAKRKTLNNAGRLSISFHSTHEDPVGLNFDINSIASQDLSSTWAAALPKLMTRRGALIGATTGSLSSQRRTSMDSEISYSIRRVSVESRRNSLDSQVSVQISEVTATRKAVATPLPTVGTGRVRTGRTKRRRREFGRNRGTRVGPGFARRGSTTSQESQLGVQILTALTIGNPQLSSLVPNLTRRRAGNAGLDGTKLTLAGRSVEPSDDPSEEETNKLSGAANNIELEEGVVIPIRPRSKISQANATDDVKLYHTEDSEDDGSSYCPELSRLVVHSSHSGTSLGTRNSIRNGAQSRGREIGTQTTISMDDMEMQELRASRGDSASGRHCISQSTQVSPPSKPHRHPERAGGLNYSYNVQRLVQELADNKAGSPVRPQRRKNSHSRSGEEERRPRTTPAS